MKSKLSRVTLIALFLALLYVPGLVWLASGGKWREPNLEKREMASWPEFSVAEIESLPGKIEKYYRDHLPFREQIIGAYAKANRALFEDCIVTTVLFGKDGWFFYSNVNDGDPVSSYRGEDLFTQAELREIVVNLRRTRENLAKRGCEFVLFIAPNKERVYSEYMPDRYGAPAENYAARQLVDFLRAHTDIRVVYCCDELMEAKAAFPEYTLYYPSDTHWNDIGSYVGARLLMRELGVELPAPDRANIRLLDAECTGDLTVLSHLYTLNSGDPIYQIADSARPEAVTEIDPDLKWMRAQGKADGPRLFVKHDSFAAGILPYMVPWFSQSVTCTNALYDETQVDETAPDVFVQVCVERYVRQQLTKGPLYTLPENR